jgi:sialic acid synthase SpsE
MVSLLNPATNAEHAMTPFNIAGREIGPDCRPLVVAEVGINHEGNVRKALQLVDAAVAAGAEIIKFQCHITEKEMIPTEMKPAKISDEKLWDIIKRCEFSDAEERQVQRYCRDKGIIYFSTPFSREAADRLASMDVPAFKIGSGECNNLPLLDHIARLGKPMILSTGMNDIESVARSIDTIGHHGVPVALLHCTSMYPTPYELVRLGAIIDLQRRFPNLPIGLSDHSLGIWTCIGAVALGACILEKHFTITRSWPGPDIPISIEPNELTDLITGADAVWRARGGHKTVLREEQPVINFAFATVVTIKAVRKGETFSAGNIWVKRPGTGKIRADQLQQVLGRTARVDLPPDSHLRPEDVEGF